MAALLALMISSSAEDYRLCLSMYGRCKEVQLKSDVLLDNVKSLMKDVKVCIVLLFSLHLAFFLISKKCSTDCLIQMML